jgi:signal transduction histidine kinase
MTNSTVLSRLSAFDALAEIPVSQLEWLAERGEVRRFEHGTVLYGRGKGEDLRGVFIVLSGRFSVRVESGGVDREIREVKAGEISGYLPYSRIKNPVAHLVADGVVDVLSIAEGDVREMTRACYDFTAACVHAMVDRAREVKSDDLHMEKLAALGRLSAGLAHELNNPASALDRTAVELDASLKEVAAASRALGAAHLTGQHQVAVEALEAAAARQPTVELSALAVADRESQFLDWLERHDLNAASADVLARSGLALADLDAAAMALDGDALGVALRHVAAVAYARQLSSDIVTAAARVHSLVTAVKAHTHMDRAAVPEAIALERHLEDTMELLGARALARDVTLELNVEPGLPRVQGVVSELNHVWLNLVDNAIDAAAKAGRVIVSARTDRGQVVVEVTDDGAGIDHENLGKVFDPFFTTKEVGHGAGLGLDVVQAVVRNHRGSVEVNSRPGRTQFRVALPIG